jgi:dCMP deaminase
MIIGLTGTLASGKGALAQFLKEKGFAYFSFGDEIREIAKQNGIELTRKNLQDLGNKLRKELGGGAIAERICGKIKTGGYENAVVDSIRSPYEIEVLRKMSDFFLVGVDAPWMIRFERIKNRNRESDPKTPEEFLAIEKRDMGEEDEMGQQVAKCMRLVDLRFNNDGSLEDTKKKVEILYGDILSKIRRPSWDEYYIGLAKLVSNRSKDPSTKTGAVIVRPDKSVCSTGFNGFPKRMPDSKEIYANREEKYSKIIHCEMNALLFSRDDSHQEYTLYTWPFLSCDRCFVHMVQAGITRFVAPKATPEILERWGASLDKVRQYAKECGVELVEI